MAAKAKSGEVPEQILIKPVNRQVLLLEITGTAPLVINRFGKKAIEQIMATQMSAEKAKKKDRTAKDFDALFRDAQHVSTEGWQGFPANGLRAAMVEACRLTGYPMTRAKMAFFVLAEGYDRRDGTPLVRVIGKAPQKVIHPVRNDNGGVDIRARAMFEPGWKAKLRIAYDGDQFLSNSVANLIERAGQQIGLCEGRPFSKDSCGMGWGTFTTLAALMPKMVG